MSSDAPTLEERYNRATQSKRLVVEERTRGDADLLIAAGWSASLLDENGDAVPLTDLSRRTRLAVSLYRLAAEFDMVRGEVHGKGPTNATEMLLILSHLKSLTDTSQQLGEYAVIRATKWKFMRDDAIVVKIVGRVLDSWLDPNCRKCDGRGASGGYGQPRLVCRRCGGTGKRRSLISQDAAENAFAARLMGDMDSMLSEADRAMRRFLRERGEA